MYSKFLGFIHFQHYFLVAFKLLILFKSRITIEVFLSYLLFFAATAVYASVNVDTEELYTVIHFVLLVTFNCKVFW